MSEDVIEQLGQALGARAAGLWTVGEGGLLQVAFWAAPDLSREVADGFALATQRVSLDQVTLGIVRAALDGLPFVSIARDLPPESGSGLWLRRFGADRSVAVPLHRDSLVIGVVSVALPGWSLSTENVIGRISGFTALSSRAAGSPQTQSGAGRDTVCEEQ